MNLNITEIERIASMLEANNTQIPTDNCQPAGLKREVQRLSRSWWIDFIIGMIIQSVI